MTPLEKVWTEIARYDHALLRFSAREHGGGIELVIELKQPGVPARNAFDDNLTHYKREIPALFCYNAMLITSAGTLTSINHDRP